MPLTINGTKLDIEDCITSATLYRTCRKCDKHKPLTQFVRNKKCKLGFTWCCKKCHGIKTKGWQVNNLDKFRDYSKKWNRQNKDKVAKYTTKYFRDRSNKDPFFRAIRKARRQTYKAFKVSYWRADSSHAILLGTDRDTARTHIESQFQPGMSWSNRSEWEIDHVIPLGRAKDENELLELCHYSNLRPLWPMQNRKRNRKQ